MVIKLYNRRIIAQSGNANLIIEYNKNIFFKDEYIQREAKDKHFITQEKRMNQ